MVYGWRAPLAHPKGERGELQARQLHTNTALGVGAATRRNTVATPSLMMEVSPSGLAARSQLVSNLAVAQLLVCFLAGLLRADSFVVAPLVALYAARERDRRALMLYGILVGAGILMDFVYLVAGAAVSWLAVGFAIVQLGLKLAVPPQPPAHRPAAPPQPSRYRQRPSPRQPAQSARTLQAHCVHAACTLRVQVCIPAVKMHDALPADKVRTLHG